MIKNKAVNKKQLEKYKEVLKKIIKIIERLTGVDEV